MGKYLTCANWFGTALLAPLALQAPNKAEAEMLLQNPQLLQKQLNAAAERCNVISAPPPAAPMPPPVPMKDSNKVCWSGIWNFRGSPLFASGFCVVDDLKRQRHLGRKSFNNLEFHTLC